MRHGLLTQGNGSLTIRCPRPREPGAGGPSDSTSGSRVRAIPRNPAGRALLYLAQGWSPHGNRKEALGGRVGARPERGLQEVPVAAPRTRAQAPKRADNQDVVPLEDVAALVRCAVETVAQGAGTADRRHVAVQAVPVGFRIVVNHVGARITDVAPCRANRIYRGGERGALLLAVG